MKKIVDFMLSFVGKEIYKNKPTIAKNRVLNPDTENALTNLEYPQADIHLGILPTQVLVMNALRDATQTYFIKSVEPLLEARPEKIWQIKQIKIVETAENQAMLEQIKKFSDITLRLMVKAVLAHRIFDNLVDISQFQDLKIISELDVEEYTGGALAILDHLNIAIQFYYLDEIVDAKKSSPALLQTKFSPPATEQAVPDNFHLVMAEENNVRELFIPNFPMIIGSSPCADIHVNQIDVSGQHVVLECDPVQKSVFLVDHSKFGTYVNDARILRDGRRVNLTGQGHFQLTRHANAIRFVYWTDAMPNVVSANLRPAVHVEPDLAPVELTT